MARLLRWSWIWCALVLLSLAGCAMPQVIVPVAPVTRTGPDGVHVAAQYVVERSGQPLGEMQVWSRGAYQVEVQGKEQTLVQISLALHNTSTTPLQLDPAQLFLDDIALGGGTLYRVPPARVDGNGPIAPSQTRTIQAYFRLPDDVRPDDVIEYRVAWQVQVQEPAGSYGNRTAFRNASYRWPYTYYDEYSWGYYPWGYYSWPYPYPGYFPYPGRAYPGYGYPRYYGPSYAGPRSRGPGYDGGLRGYTRPSTSRELAAPRAR
jgi:hypothetical protein